MPQKKLLLHSIKSLNKFASLLLVSAVFYNLPVQAQTYLGINNGTGFNTSSEYTDTSIYHTKQLNLGMVRMGMDGIQGWTEGAAFEWSGRDGVVNKYRQAGIEIHALLSPRGQVNRYTNYEQWKANFNYYVRNLMAHYKGKIFYYIIDNEPDWDFGNGFLTAQECFDMTRIAFQAAREIDPNIKIESPAPTAAFADIFSQMLDLGIDKVSDYIGMHAYGGQIHESNFGLAWRLLEERGIRKPIAISESGSISRWCPGSPSQQDDCRRRWFAKFAQQLKRFGYDHALLFDLDEHGEWALAPNFNPTSSYQEVRSLQLNPALANTGFESDNNVEKDWVPFNNEDIGPSPHVTFVRGDSGGAHGGNGYVKLESGKAQSGTPINVRRIAGQLPQGKTVKIGAWVYVNGGGTATLKALGYDSLNGDAEISKSSTGKNGWEYLEISVPISKYWTVVELGTAGTGIAGDYVKWDDVTLLTP